jgi:D-beta-D-heptose 7-phosphate kinase/D-beta-D-heptose 1-phosphate adenosyltransferase
MEQFTEPDDATIRSLFANMLGKKVVVIGDAILDHYLIGSVDRISPEAPVPIINFSAEHHTLGGSANVAQCAEALGAKVELISIVGNDPEGNRLKAMASDLGIHTERILVDFTRPTTSKTRIVAGNQHVARIDREHCQQLPEVLQHRLATEIEHATQHADVVILADYAKGVLTTLVCQAAIKAARDKPSVVDPKGLNWGRYSGATVIKPNAKEAEAVSGSRIQSDEEAAIVGRRISQDLQAAHVMITMGPQGAVLVARANGQNHASTMRFPSRAREVFDVTGAGDTVAATLGVALAGGASMAQAAWLANAAAGVCVSRFGTGSVSQRDIISAVDDQSLQSTTKVVSRPDALRLAMKLKSQGKRLAFTNGCFDLLHIGHVTLLEKSRSEADALFVGVNSDESVRRLKGSSRPIQHESDRARILAGQGCVDAVVLFDEDTPYELIQALRPDVITKGAEYSRKEDVVGWDIVERSGGTVRLLDMIEGHSSTRLIDRARMLGSAPRN